MTSTMKGLKDSIIQAELWSFVELCNVFHRFVTNFSHVAAPRYKKLRKGEPNDFQTFSVTEKNAVELLKILPKNPPVLAVSRADGHLTLDTDASDIQLRCISLQQHQGESTRPRGYWWMTLTKPEKKLATTYRECLVDVSAILLLRANIEQSRSTVRNGPSGS